MTARHGGGLVAACLATVLLLGGCAGDGSTPDGSSAASTPTSDAAGAAQKGSAPSGGKDKKASKGSSDPSASPSTDPSSSPTEEPPANGGGTDPSVALEVPVAPEPTVDSLGEMLGDADRPLVTAPLPRAATARGRLVGGFPSFLRPASGTLVETSSVSPQDDRLQVALVGSTALAPAKVLLAFRTRLGRRGMLEQATPQTAAGSQAAALRRGRSVVTITATRQGSRTSYSVMASLHTGQE
ncbi:hypothetical protein J2X46_001411 [Nocardioides sp. BE266]|uniref:hypothetical protein n=1 Tax=Nocardioides sp. BE266 TaxID=2817725 RepID=UPI0028563260|nr:hypothetical protein [Nocardioides sp. BE266]MDR7252435.1 hypothetical protein [Nocardioides sp. BE266]